MIAQPRSAGRAALRVLRVAGAGAMVCALGLLPGCGTRAAQPLALGSDPPPPAADPLKRAMPTKDDFPPDWHVQEQDERPVALPGLNDTGTVFSAIAPARCQQFAAGFVSAPGSSVPGDFVASAIAMIPNAAGRVDQSSVVVYATRHMGDWGSPKSIRDSARDCSKVTGTMSMRGRSMDVSFVSAPLDTGDIHAEAAGRTTTITASGARILMAVVHARTKGVLIAASSMVVSGSGDDQGALLVRLVRRTVDRLDGR